MVFSTHIVHYDKLLFTKEVNFYGSQQKLCPTTTNTKFQLTFNSLRPSDAIWQNKSGPTFAQVVDFCLATLSHYLNHSLTYHHIHQLDSFHNSLLKFTTKIQIKALPHEPFVRAIRPIGPHHKGPLTHWGLVMPYGAKIWVNIGSGNGLLPDGTKPLPEPMLTYHQQSRVTFN